MLQSQKTYNENEEILFDEDEVEYKEDDVDNL